MSITKRIDNITHLKSKYLKAILDPPISVKIELTRKCNFKCRFCANSSIKSFKGHMDETLYKRLVKELFETGVKELGVFYFGESFLNPYLPMAIKYAKDIGFSYVFLTTNGSIATPKNVKACMEAGLDSLKFSLNYADENQFKEITDTNSKIFFRVIENIKEACNVRKAGGYKTGLYASYINYDGEQGEKMKRIIDDVSPYLDQVYALPLYNQSAKIKNDDWEFSVGNRGRFEKMVEPLPCWALFQEAHINFDGTVNACCFAVSDDFIMGDLKKTSFMEAWNSEKFQNLRRAHLNKNIFQTPCEHCVVGNV